MAIKTKAQLKAYFQTGSKPTQAQFEDLIDSFQDYSDSIATIETAELVKRNSYQIPIYKQSSIASLLATSLLSIDYYDAYTTLSIATPNSSGQFEFLLDSDTSKEILSCNGIDSDGLPEMSIGLISTKSWPQVTIHNVQQQLTSTRVSLTGNAADILLAAAADYSQVQFVLSYNGETIAYHITTPFLVRYESTFMCFANAWQQNNNLTGGVLVSISTVNANSRIVDLHSASSMSDYTLEKIIVTKYSEPLV